MCEWLKSIGLGEYREIFTLFDIGGDRLLHLDKEQLKVRFIVLIKPRIYLFIYLN